MDFKATNFLNNFIFAAVLCFLCGTATAQTATMEKTFTESSTWEVPAEVTSQTIECVGGGGSGSQCTGISDENGAKGANGYVAITYVAPPVLAVDDMTDTVCSGESFTIIPSGTIPEGTTYSWSAPSVPGISGTTSGSGASNISGTLTNSTYNNIDVVYNVTASSSSNTENFTVTITVRGIIDPGIITTEDAKNNYCHGTSIDDTLTANPSVGSGIYTIQWQEWNGNEWTTVAGANDTLYKIVITNFTASQKFRYTIQLPGCATVASTNTWELNVATPPVINKLIPADTCPGLEEYYISADITPGSGTYTYFWDGSINGTTSSIDTIPASPYPCDQQYNYRLTVEDEHGCPSNTINGSFTTSDESNWTPVTEVSAQINPANRTYMVPNLKDTLEACFHTTCNLIVNSTYVQVDTAGTEMAPNTTVTVVANYKTVCGTTYNISIDVKAPATLSPFSAADIDFDDSNDTITLYYGICDTLYYVHIPSYSTTGSSQYSINDLSLSNDKSSANEGAILGRITAGEYTIVWRLTSPSGTYIEYPKKYVVVYPPCGGTMIVADVDGNEYETVRLGCECWTRTNLKTITGVTGNSYVYQNKDANTEKFGRLYSWYSAVGLPENSTAAPTTATDPISNITYIQGICPSGWALPTDGQYRTMANSVANFSDVKSDDASKWLPGAQGTNGSGFEAVASGYYDPTTGRYYNLLGETYYWTSTPTTTVTKGNCSYITHSCPMLIDTTQDKGMGLSVRCVKIAQ